MTSTVTMTTTEPLPTLSLSTDRVPPPCCPGCGFTLDYAPPLPTTAIHAGKVDSEDAARSLLEAQARIADLEAQVRLLNQKATAAIDRWADYEDELARLRQQATSRTTSEPAPPQQQQQQQQQTPTRPAPISSSSSPAPPSPSPTRASFLPSAAGGVANRLSALLSRKSQPNLRPPSLAPPDASPTADDPAPAEEQQHPLNAHADLLLALRHEKKLRAAAESRLSTTSREVEELSVSLFEQANEMVATERRTNARLAERVEVLERRDADKKRRLERLEGAMGRIERVRALLGEGTPKAAASAADDDAPGTGEGQTTVDSDQTTVDSDQTTVDSDQTTTEDQTKQPGEA